MKKNTLGNTAGSILAFQLMHRTEENKPTRVVKTEAQRRQEEFDQIRKEDERDFVQVEVPLTPYEQAIAGPVQTTKIVSVPRAEFEKTHGIQGLRKAWSRDSETIQTMAGKPMERVKMIDDGVRWPLSSTPPEMTDENVAKFTNQAKAFLDSKNLSPEDFNRIVLFVGIQADSNSLIDVLNPEIWSIAYQRLQQLGCLTSEPTRTEVPIQPQVEQSDTLSADEFRTDAEARWYSIWEDSWNQWLDSMAQAWSFYPNRAQAHAAIDLLIKLESYGNDMFNECRRRLTASGVFKPGMLTDDELLAEKFEKGTDCSSIR